MRAKVLISILELILVYVFTCKILKALCVITFQVMQGDQCNPSRKWNTVADLLFDCIPSLGTISALRVLNYVTPGVLAVNLTQCIGECKLTGKWYNLPIFLVARLCYAAIGIDAFMVKFITAADATRATSGQGLFWEILTTASFLNQMLGIVNVGMFARGRLLLFIFGGENGEMSADELAKVDTWHAMLAKEMWEASRSCKFATPWFLAVMLSFTDYDFQKLTLNGEGAANFLAMDEEDIAAAKADADFVPTDDEAKDGVDAEAAEAAA